MVLQTNYNTGKHNYIEEFQNLCLTKTIESTIKQEYNLIVVKMLFDENRCVINLITRQHVALLCA